MIDKDEFENTAESAITLIRGAVGDVKAGENDWAMVALDDAMSTLSSLLAMLEDADDGN